MSLSKEQVHALDADGFVVVPRALDAEWLERLALAFDGAPAPSNGTRHVALSTATVEFEAWRALERHPVALAAAEHVLGGSFRVRDLHGRSPLPGFGQQGLHSDGLPRAGKAPYFVVTALFMIDAFSAENGATRVVPGSHRRPGPVPRSYAQPLAVHTEERIIAAAAGSVLLLNGHVWHSGRRNSSASPRRAAQMVMVAP
jgi:ectoine hydroxylase-related dioxygenase (phytanoyl-CoA dioxygenase family)